VSEPRSFPFLAVQAQFLSDLEAVRIANDNRIRALRDDLGLADGEPELLAALGIAELLQTAEGMAEKDVRKAVRALPFYPWIKSMTGLGDKQTARLLGVIGHPCWRYDNEQEEWFPRTVGQLWSYCGYAVVGGHAPRRKKDEQAAYNTDARTRCFLIAESCIKQMHSPLRAVYDEGRVKYADATHKEACVRCGPKGKPAVAGSPLSDGHKHARALRLVAKTMLKELWVAAGESA